MTHLIPRFGTRFIIYKAGTNLGEKSPLGAQEAAERLAAECQKTGRKMTVKAYEGLVDTGSSFKLGKWTHIKSWVGIEPTVKLLYQENTSPSFSVLEGSSSPYPHVQTELQALGITA